MWTKWTNYSHSLSFIEKYTYTKYLETVFVILAHTSVMNKHKRKSFFYLAKLKTYLMVNQLVRNAI